MNVQSIDLAGVLIIKPDVFYDRRGKFFESFRKNFYNDSGIKYELLQDNFSYSLNKVLRGLHFQKIKPQGKIVTCLKGQIFDVIVDIDPNSPTFCQYFSIELSENNNLQLWIPPNYAHGFCVLSQSAIVHYKCTEYFDQKDQGGVLWNDITLNIDWPIKDPILSDKDSKLLTIKELF